MTILGPYALFYDTVLLQVRLYIAPMQYNVYNDDYNKEQSCPFMNLDQEMPQGNQETFPISIPFGQNKPVDQAGNAQKAEKNKRYHIDYPEFKCLPVHHLRPL
jgi:hypothetical protein